MDLNKFTDELILDEGFKPHAYQDSEGFWTIGIGTLIDKRKGGGLTLEEAKYLANNRIKKAQDGVFTKLPWVKSLTDARQRALVNMAYQMGVEGLLGFKNSLEYIRLGSYEKAAINLRISKWYKQTPNRAERVIQMVLKG